MPALYELPPTNPTSSPTRTLAGMSAAAPSRSRWQIGTLTGVPVYLGKSWVIVAAVIMFLFGPAVSDIVPGLGPIAGYAVAAFFAVLLLLSVLVHEAAHALTARRCGFTVQRIVADFWGGHTAYQGGQHRPGQAAAVAVAGPMANAALALGGWLLVQDLDRGVLWLLLTAFTTANGFVAVFNLLPGLPLDGGFLVEALVWRITGSRGLGTLVAGWCGRLLVLGLLWWAIGIPLTSGVPLDLYRILWVGLIAAFLFAGATRAVRAGGSRRRFEATTIESVWRPVRHVLANASVHSIDWGRAPLWVVTGPDGSPIGLVDEQALRAVPTTGQATTPVSSVALRQPPGWVLTATPEQSVVDVVASMQAMQSPVVAVQLPNGDVPAVIFAADL